MQPSLRTTWVTAPAGGKENVMKTLVGTATATCVLFVGMAPVTASAAHMSSDETPTGCRTTYEVDIFTFRPVWKPGPGERVKGGWMQWGSWGQKYSWRRMVQGGDCTWRTTGSGTAHSPVPPSAKQRPSETAGAGSPGRSSSEGTSQPPSTTPGEQIRPRQLEALVREDAEQSSPVVSVGRSFSGAGPRTIRLENGDGVQIDCVGTGRMVLRSGGREVGAMQCADELVTAPRSGYGISGQEFEGRPRVSVQVAEGTIWALVVTRSS